ncbi:MAG: hypothetical protein MUF22_00205 [Chitinispirillaceae bacterium]|jgi:hypothetical protein|nr:hypothetical protein [Chitinispirillaceae bacterium]
MKNQLISGLVISVTALCLVGCSTITQESPDKARSALDLAKKEGAEIYAPAQFRAAQVSYELGQKELMAETRKLPFMRKYDKLNEIFASAHSAAQSALRVAKEEKAKMQKDAGDLIAGSQKAIDRVDSLIVVAAGKKIVPDTALIIKINSVRQDISIAAAALAAGDYRPAVETIRSLQDSLAVVIRGAESLIPAKKSRRR